LQGATSVALMNLSLQINSIGFYQISKLCIIPTVLLIEYYTEGKRQSHRVHFSLFLLLLGVGVTTVTDVDLSWRGEQAEGTHADSSSGCTFNLCAHVPGHFASYRHLCTGDDAECYFLRTHRQDFRNHLPGGGPQ